MPLHYTTSATVAWAHYWPQCIHVALERLFEEVLSILKQEQHSLSFKEFATDSTTHNWWLKPTSEELVFTFQYFTILLFPRRKVSTKVIHCTLFNISRWSVYERFFPYQGFFPYIPDLEYNLLKSLFWWEKKDNREHDWVCERLVNILFIDSICSHQPTKILSKNFLEMLMTVLYLDTLATSYNKVITFYTGKKMLVLLLNAPLFINLNLFLILFSVQVSICFSINICWSGRPITPLANSWGFMCCCL